MRIIAATNRDLQQAVARRAASARTCYYRLNVIPIRLPPLRERREDIPLLVEHFLERMSAELGRRVDGVSRDGDGHADAVHDWPGNVRELRNVLERGDGVRGRARSCRSSDFGLGEAARQPLAAPASLEEVERRHIAAILGSAAAT